MPILRLDYQRNMRPVPWGGIALLVMAVLALLLTGAYYRKLNDQATLWEAKAKRIKMASQQQLQVVRHEVKAPADLALEVKGANEVLHRLNLPWEDLFQAVESAGNKEIALLALEPDTDKHLLKISGEAKNMAALLDYIKRLEERSAFGTVYLQSHQVQQQNPDKPVRFALLAIWRGKS